MEKGGVSMGADCNTKAANLRQLKKCSLHWKLLREAFMRVSTEMRPICMPSVSAGSAWCQAGVVPGRAGVVPGSNPPLH